MPVVDPGIDAYQRSLLDRYDEPVLLEMEASADAGGFPIVGRAVGVTLELLARSIGARRVMELGSGYGYSAYWFSRAVGPRGEIHCTDADPANADAAERYLTRAGLWAPVTFHLGDAVEALDRIDGDFDIVFCDIDKEGYPDAWRAAAERIHVGGLYLCDNTLGTSTSTILDDTARTRAIREHNRLIAEDERYLSTLVPTRQGVIVALRLR
jgi:predicted O-methyltransferase YrrM